MQVVCLDLEGVLVPEIWIKFAEKTGIDALKATTRDIPDYDELMQQRLRLLSEHDLDLTSIHSVIREMTPMPGAKAFLDGLRERFQVIILSDTFYEFAGPLMEQLDYTILFCNFLVVDENGRIADYRLRQSDGKTKAVNALQGLNFQTIAAGDSYNDTGMLKTADAGILFCPPDNVILEFPQFPVTPNYGELKEAFQSTKKSLLGK